MKCFFTTHYVDLKKKDQRSSLPFPVQDHPHHNLESGPGYRLKAEGLEATWVCPPVNSQEECRDSVLSSLKLKYSKICIDSTAEPDPMSSGHNDFFFLLTGRALVWWIFPPIET